MSNGDTPQITSWDQSDWMAKCADDAAIIGPPMLPEHVALPGAKQAVPHDRLLAYQDMDMGELAIVERVNGRWAEENAERLEAHARWVAGPYMGALEELRKREAETAAAKLRERAAWEQMLREREED